MYKADAAGAIVSAVFVIVCYLDGLSTGYINLTPTLTDIAQILPFMASSDLVTFAWTGQFGTEFWRSALVVAGWTAVLSSLAIRRFRWDADD